MGRHRRDSAEDLLAFGRTRVRRILGEHRERVDAERAAWTGVRAVFHDPVPRPLVFVSLFLQELLGADFIVGTQFDWVQGSLPLEQQQLAAMREELADPEVRSSFLDCLSDLARDVGYPEPDDTILYALGQLLLCEPMPSPEDVEVMLPLATRRNPVKPYRPLATFDDVAMSSPVERSDAVTFLADLSNRLHPIQNLVVRRRGRPRRAPDPTFIEEFRAAMEQYTIEHKGRIPTQEAITQNLTPWISEDTLTDRLTEAGTSWATERDILISWVKRKR